MLHSSSQATSSSTPGKSRLVFGKLLILIIAIAILFSTTRLNFGVEGHIITFRSENITIPTQQPRELDKYELGMYARNDLPLNFLIRPIANGDTFVKVQLAVSRSTIPKEHTKLIVLMGRTKAVESAKLDDTRTACALKSVPSNILLYRSLTPDDDIDENFEISETDFYSFILHYCPPIDTSMPNLPNTVSFFLNGEVQFINPYGHLPGQYFFFMPFQAVMTIAYIIYAVCWFFVSIINRKEFLILQFYITAVLMCCLAESVIVYFHLFLTNKVGYIDLGYMIMVQLAAVLMTVLRKTFTRLIVLVICSGFIGKSNDESSENSENEKASTGIGSWSILCFVTTFVITCSISELGDMLFYREIISHTFFLVMSIPVSVLDFIFYIWSLYLLYSTMKMYKPSSPRAVTASERVSPEWKKAVAHNHYFYLYRRLMLAMIIYAAMVMLFLALQFLYEYGRYYIDAWYLNWFFDTGSFQMAFFCIFVLIGFLYRPAKHNSLYLHAEQLPTDELDAELMLKEGTGLEYHSDDSDEKDVEMMMMHNDPMDASEESNNQNENAPRKSEEKLVFVQEQSNEENTE
ncbi:hypothetical protein C9374_001023 [Naegleria lovaniensis]|uniref:GOST seven transmembrane domain-containing protein n=1 Tax=Naegleria lovaniensis TaxID=51637 RepID=A0AA88GXH0_NAELO|nr:uncharacterized protein C9374_001023 [Naegleria lovaniensis]KAG2388173.1 hypothetical protein C9374_001023 [Naegleria lovaniensis]